MSSVVRPTVNLDSSPLEWGNDHITRREIHFLKISLLRYTRIKEIPALPNLKEGFQTVLKTKTGRENFLPASE